MWGWQARLCRWAGLRHAIGILLVMSRVILTLVSEMPIVPLL